MKAHRRPTSQGLHNREQGIPVSGGRTQKGDPAPRMGRQGAKHLPGDERGQLPFTTRTHVLDATW